MSAARHGNHLRGPAAGRPRAQREELSLRFVDTFIGSDARALGGALLPLYAQFAPDRDLFLKVAA